MVLDQFKLINMQRYITSSLVLFIISLLLIPTVSSCQKKGTELQLDSKNFKRLVDNSIDFSVPLISVEEFHENLEDYIILDARERKEYEVSHIPNAIYVGYDQPEIELINNLDKSKKLLFYCSIGYRSEKIAEKAAAMGFDQVYNLYGSIFEWANKGYELENTENEPTNQVHGYNRIWGKWIKNDAYEKVYNK